MTPLIIDLVAVVILVVTIVVCARRGFLASAVSFVGSLVSALIAGFAASFLSDYLYKSFVQEQVYTTVINALKNMTDFSGLASQLSSLEQLPPFLSQYLGNIDTEALLEGTAQTAEGIAKQLIDFAIAPMITMLLYAVIFLVLFAILRIFVRLLTKTLIHVRDIPVIGSLNAFLGGVFGVLKGALLLYIAFVALSILLTVCGSLSSSLTLQDLQNSYLYTLFSPFSPLTI